VTLTSSAWRLFGVVSALLALWYASGPDSLTRLGLTGLLGFGSAAAVLVGARMHRVSRPLPWVLVAGGLATFALGDAISLGHEVATGTEAPSPYYSDAASLSCYVFLVAALMLLVRMRCGADSTSLIDASILTTGLGLPVWVLLVLPNLRSDELSLAAQLCAVAYPLADIAVIAVLSRLWWAPGGRPVSFLLLVTGCLPLLLCDVIHGIEVLSGHSTGSWAEGFCLLFYVCWGTAALHPSMASLTEPSGAAEATLGRSRVVGLALAGLIAPAVLLAQDSLTGRVDAAPIAVASVLLFVFVLARVAGLVSSLAESDSRQRSAAHFQALVQSGSDLITLVDDGGTVTYQSPSIEKVLGIRTESVVGSPLRDLLHPDDASRLLTHLEAARAGSGSGVLEVRMRNGAGGWQWVEALGNTIVDDLLGTGVVLTSRDVSERKTLEDQLTRQAYHDPLTGLANRRLFADRVAAALRSRGDQPIVVMFVDLDDFKTVNDSLGHAAGDRLLVEVARRLVGAVRSGDSVARLGGDEFAVLLETEVEPDTAERIAARLIEVLREPLMLAETEVVAQASIGVASASPGDQPDELLRNADLAMYMAKGSGKSRYEIYQPAMHAATVGRLELVADLRRALHRGEFRLHYQPTVSLTSGGVSGIEALVRWQHPDRGLVSPAEFIPIAEETGIIVPLSRWILGEACREAVRLPRPDGQPAISVAVNISPRHLADPGVVDDVALALAESGLDPARLVIEITESGLVGDSEDTIATMEALKRLGVRLAVDDFGTGYSSLAYLRRFPIDMLKVDKCFVDGLGSGGESGALVRAILQLAASMHMTTVAEGIEMQDQLTELSLLGCDLGQGFLLSRPVPADELAALLAAHVGETPTSGLQRQQARISSSSAAPASAAPHG
jgi:diguanylate cyclase (GGDEF)-like protein/PAS domain S-box-containing protein